MHTITQQQLDEIEQQDRKWRWPGVTGPGQYTWNEKRNRYEPQCQALGLVPVSQVSQESESPHDFSSSGLGIGLYGGGLGSHEEPAFVPTVAQMERLEKMEERATYCRRCGQGERTGAMFTTMAGSGLCDDCCG